MPPACAGHPGPARNPYRHRLLFRHEQAGVCRGWAHASRACRLREIAAHASGLGLSRLGLTLPTHRARTDARPRHHRHLPLPAGPWASIPRPGAPAWRSARPATSSRRPPTSSGEAGLPSFSNGRLYFPLLACLAPRWLQCSPHQPASTFTRACAAGGVTTSLFPPPPRPQDRQGPRRFGQCAAGGCPRDWRERGQGA